MIDKTPGVYVVEQSTLPPSVAEVATAVPAFIGYTQKRPKKGTTEQVGVVVETVNTLLEFEERFGKTLPTTFNVDANDVVTPTNERPMYLMWYALKMYFDNGGGRCYVVSIGGQSGTLAKSDFEKGFDELKRYDEPTLVVVPEAVGLEPADHKVISEAALKHCKEMADRFAILDVIMASGADSSTSTDASTFRELGTDNGSYGAAYYPYLRTSLAHVYDDTSVMVTPGSTLQGLKSTDPGRYNKIKLALSTQRAVMPPSPAIAGVYARVDGSRGIWKAPANVTLMSVIEPMAQLSDTDQDHLNVDSFGKSINAIRAFSGRGILVWGARTLDGQSNEWRYVPVRRLFITVEESVKKASSFAVFEPNDANTWLKVKGMIDGYLYGLWERGALQGNKPEAAYFVKVGLGVTMSPEDILAGRMKVQIGLAAVRPSEFIELNFSHKMAEA